MKTGRPGKSVMCINDGTIYGSLEAAATKYCISRSAISKHIHGDRKSVRGLYFIEISGNETPEELQTIREKELFSQYHIIIKEGVLI